MEMNRLLGLLSQTWPMRGGRALNQLADMTVNAVGSVPQALASLPGEVWGGITAPRDAWQGKLDPLSPEAISRINSLSGLIMGGTFGAPAGAIGIGPVRRLGAADYQRILESQRATEGMRAAMRDPVTGEIFTGWTHQGAIDSVPKGNSDVWTRLYNEWDKATDNSGFIDKTGKFISRSEAEKNYGISTMEDLRDLRKGNR